MQFQNFAKFTSIKHFVSTRQGGISPAPFDNLNLSFGTDDLPENVVQNRKMLAEATQMPLENWCVPSQTHSDNILCISVLERGKGAFSQSNALPDTDGLLSKYKNIVLAVQSADCVCSLYYDTEKQVIGAAHAGWRGTLKLLPQKMVLTMQKEFGSKPENIWIGIAPSISLEKYEVGDEVVSEVEKVFGTKENFLWWNDQNQKFHFNLQYAHLFQLQEVGINPEHIEIMPHCTYTEQDLFFSARRDKNQTGRFGAGIMLV